MKTKLLTAMSEDDTQSVSAAAEILKSGGLVAIPTETVYGLAASAYSEQAVKNIFKAKGRPGDNPLIVHISNIDQLDDIADGIDDTARKCMEEFWPGPFTAVVKKSRKIPYCVSGGLETVAVRMPSNPVARAIISASGLPLAAPSANLSGSPSPTTARHTLNDLNGRVDAIVMSGDCSVGVESTVVSFVCNPPRLLRPGGITLEQLRQIIPEITVDPAVVSEPEEGAAVASPGMKYKHYSPKADVVMVVGTSGKFCEYCNNNTDNFDLALCFEEDKDCLKLPFVCYGKEHDDKTQAELLFIKLHEIDERGFKKVAAHAPEKSGIGLAVYNRLIRAAGFNVIEL